MHQEQKYGQGGNTSYAVDTENIASQKLAERLGGVKKETKNTLPENIIKLMNEVLEQDNSETFKHYEYWIN